jgi:hypothetical protein
MVAILRPRKWYRRFTKRDKEAVLNDFYMFF